MKKGLAIFLAILLLGTAITAYVTKGFKDWNPYGWFDKEKEAEPDEEALLVNDFAEVKSEANENTPLAMLSLSLSNDSVVTYSEEANTVSKTITATITPSSATNKKVKWSVDWFDSQSGTVTDYITVTPDSEGSLTATVTCKKAFTGNILITCTTVDGGFEAFCTVTFVGYPSDFVITGNVEETNGAYSLRINADYSFTVGLSNSFNSVGSSFMDNVSVEVKAVGQITVGDYLYSVSSKTGSWTDSSLKTIDIESIKDNFISASYSNGILSVKLLSRLTSYCGAKETSGNFVAYTNKYKSGADSCYYTITLTESTTGLTKTMKILESSEAGVTGVSLSLSEMTF